MVINQFDENIEKKSRLYGIIGTSGIAVFLLAFLFLLYMPTIFLPEDDGILVSFGDSFDGGGTGGDYYGGRAGGGGDANEYATPQGAVPETAPPRPTQTTATRTQAAPTDNYATQDDASDATIIQKKKEQEQERQRLLAEQENARIAQQQQIAEQQRLAKEAEQRRLAAEAEQKRLAEEARKKQEAIDKANRLGSSLAGGANATPGSGTGFGGGTGTGNASGDGTGNGTGTGAGVGDGTENSRQGNPVGKGSPTGNWSLTGRQLIGSLAPPVYNRNVEGKITVSIRVDANGIVTNATISSPTDISDGETRTAAIVAAKKTRFSTGSGISTGTITYNFRLR